MRIQHNIMAMNSYRNYTNNASALSKNLEKLSSGYKINRAGDDAAGLAISEKMRAQIQGLNAAQKNVKDGISLVKTAEGAMQEIQDMLSRMKYLATQSANGTYDNDVDRAALQDEINSLRSEIDRIADSANFNGTNLLDGKGTPSDPTVETSFQMDVDMIYSTEATSGTVAGAFGGSASISFGGADLGDVSEIEINFEAGAITNADGSTDGVSATAQFDSDTGKLTITIKQAGSEAATPNAAAVQTAINNAIASAGGANMDVTITIGGTIDPDLFKSDTDGANGIGESLTLTVSGTPDPDALTQFETDYGISDIDLSGLTLEKGAEGDVTVSYDATENKLIVKVGEQTFTSEEITTIAAETTGDITLTDEEGNEITVTLAASQTVIGTDGTGITPDTKVGTYEAGEKTNEGSGQGYVSVQLQIGDDSASHNKLKFLISDMHVDAMGKSEKKKDPDAADDATDAAEYYKLKEGATSIADIDITSVSGANDSLDVIKDAINYVSSVRGQLGAIQNRLEHTQNNLSVMAENIQDAESTIRDTDVADEMMAYVKNNILIQSAQAMLAQANQVPQGVLQLLG